MPFTLLFVAQTKEDKMATVTLTWQRYCVRDDLQQMIEVQVVGQPDVEFLLVASPAGELDWHGAGAANARPADMPPSAWADALAVLAGLWLDRGTDTGAEVFEYEVADA